jgi:hypothetical protein
MGRPGARRAELPRQRNPPHVGADGGRLGRAIFLEPESGRRLLAALLAVAGIACLLPAR